MSRAHGNASRIHSFFDAVDAESTLIRIAFRMDKPRIVGTGSHAGFASYAFLMIDKNYTATLVYVTCAAWTAVNAGRIIAMIAALAANLHVECRVNSLCVIGDPVAIETLRDLVLCLAGHDAIHTAYALLCINNHGVASHGYTSSISKVTKLTFMPVPPIRGSVAYLVINWESLAPLPKACLSPLEVCPNPWTM
jgi:hypothetical protein